MFQTHSMPTCRYATRRSRDFPSDPPPQAGHDVFGHSIEGDSNDLQKVHAECESRRRDFSAKFQPLEIYVDDETKLTLHGLQQYFLKLEEREKNRKLNDLLDNLEFNQVRRQHYHPNMNNAKVCIFVKSVPRATQLDALLQECNFPSICIHSGLAQPER